MPKTATVKAPAPPHGPPPDAPSMPPPSNAGNHGRNPPVRARAPVKPYPQNALKHGRYALQHRLFAQGLAAQRASLRVLLLHRRLQILNPRNELLPRLAAMARKYDRIFRVRLYQAFHPPDYAKILLFHGG